MRLSEKNLKVILATDDARFHQIFASLTKDFKQEVAYLQTGEQLERAFAEDPSACYFADEKLVCSGTSPLVSRIWPPHLTIIVSPRGNARTIDLITRFDRINHILSAHSQHLEVELGNILQDMQGTNPGQLASRLKQGAEVHTRVITSFQYDDALLRNFRTFAKNIDAYSDFADTAATCLWELVSNALFDAPVHKTTGQPTHYERNRTDLIKIPNGKTIQVGYGRDDGMLVAFVEDQFGSLQRESLVKNLARCQTPGPSQIKMSGGGAGVGTYLVLHSVTYLNYYVWQDMKTRVLFAMHISKRRLDREKHSSSLNFFHYTDG